MPVGDIRGPSRQVSRGAHEAYNVQRSPWQAEDTVWNLDYEVARAWLCLQLNRPPRLGAFIVVGSALGVLVATAVAANVSAWNGTTLPIVIALWGPVLIAVIGFVVERTRQRRRDRNMRHAYLAQLRARAASSRVHD